MVTIRWSNSRHQFVVVVDLTVAEARRIASEGLDDSQVADLLAATELVEQRNRNVVRKLAASA